MSYTFTIGNAKPFFDEEELYADYTVDIIEHPNAPSFPNDEMTGQTNSRSPSYYAWYSFCEIAGILPLFYNDRESLKAGHPGIQKIGQDDLDLVRLSLKKRLNTSTRPPGFSGPPVYDKISKSFVYEDEDKYDAILARLIWLEWWMTYALTECKIPAIRNT